MAPVKFGGPGYESAVASGVVLPAAAAIATAIDVSASDLAPLQSAVRGLVTGAGFAAVALLTILLHGLRAGMCDLWGGTLLFLLTAGLGAPLGGLWGAVVAERCRGRPRRRLRCVLLALAGPLGGIAISVARFYGSPMIFAYDPFFGYFSGALYDTVVDVRAELWSYRAGTVATLVGSALVAASLVRTAEGRLAPRGTLRLVAGVAQVRGPGDHGVPLGHGIGFGLPAILRVSLRRRNMSGNVDEWVYRDRTYGEWRSALKGGWWMAARDRRRPATTAHDESFHELQTGLRCCSGAE